MTNPKIVVETFPDDGQAMTRRHFHVNKRISNVRYLELFGGRTFNFLNSDEPLSDKAQSLVLDLHAIEGITDVTLEHYEIKLVIARAFSWDNLEALVMDVIKRFVGWTEEEIEKLEIERIEKRYKKIESCDNSPLII